MIQEMLSSIPGTTTKRLYSRHTDFLVGVQSKVDAQLEKRYILAVADYETIKERRLVNHESDLSLLGTFYYADLVRKFPVLTMADDWEFLD